MRMVLILGLAVAGFSHVQSAAAQAVFPLSFEARGSLAFPTGDFPISGGAAGGGANSGWGVGVSAAYAFIPGFSIYGGWDRFTFGAADDAGLGADAEFIDDGFAVGARVNLPLPIAATPWVRGGGLFRTLQTRGATGIEDVNPRSSRSPGFEVGAGLDIPLGMVISFTPGVIYRSYKPDFGTAGSQNVSYIDAGVGMRVRL